MLFIWTSRVESPQLAVAPGDIISFWNENLTQINSSHIPILTMQIQNLIYLPYGQKTEWQLLCV